MADPGGWILIIVILVVLGATAIAYFVSMASYFTHAARHLRSIAIRRDRGGRSK
jgi:hypothetical protein